MPAGGQIGFGFGFEGRSAGQIIPQVSGMTFGAPETLPPPGVTLSDAGMLEGTGALVFTLSLSRAPGRHSQLPRDRKLEWRLPGRDHRAE